MKQNKIEIVIVLIINARLTVAAKNFYTAIH